MPSKLQKALKAQKTKKMIINRRVESAGLLGEVKKRGGVAALIGKGKKAKVKKAK